MIMSCYTKLLNLRGFSEKAVKLLAKFLIISENLKGFYEMCVT